MSRLWCWLAHQDGIETLTECRTTGNVTHYKIVGARCLTCDRPRRIPRSGS